MSPLLQAWGKPCFPHEPLLLVLHAPGRSGAPAGRSPAPRETVSVRTNWKRRGSVPFRGRLRGVGTSQVTPPRRVGERPGSDPALRAGTASASGSAADGGVTPLLQICNDCSTPLSCRTKSGPWIQLSFRGEESQGGCCRAAHPLDRLGAAPRIRCAPVANRQLATPIEPL